MELAELDADATRYLAALLEDCAFELTRQDIARLRLRQSPAAASAAPEPEPEPRSL
jgi:hypothetical protein